MSGNFEGEKVVVPALATIFEEDFKTKEGADLFAKYCKECTELEWSKRRLITPVAHILINRDPDGALLEKTTVLSVPFFVEFSQEAKDEIANVIHSLCDSLMATAVAFVSEAWFASVKNDDAALQEMKRLSDEGRLSEFNGRKEVVHISFEHNAVGSRIYYAEIAPDRSLGEFASEDCPEVKGRFAGFLERDFVN